MNAVTLDDKYAADSGRIYLNGIQALVRLMLVQRRRDLAAGLNTAGFVSGYRGSPLGGLDEALWAARPHLDAHHVTFQPGVNEELAATAVWGTQQVHLTGGSRYDGVFAMWYGKGPGVDRCGDVFKHMNFAGTAARGGVLLVAGDDHGAYSSTLPHQSDHLFAASMIPVLYPCNVEEYLELGLHGFAMSRFSGCAVGFKALADTVESSASIAADVHEPRIVLPEIVIPDGGLNARLSRDTLGVQARRQEALMQDYKIYAAIAYARANNLNRIVVDPPNARLGIVASGKSWMDVLEALEELGIGEREAADIGIRLFKVAMPWPLEPDGVRTFARGLEEILVVEEKRQMVEYQLKEQLYNWHPDVRPRVVGKFDEQGEWVAPRGRWLLPAKGDFSVAQIARVIAERVARFHPSDRIRARLAFLEAKEAVLGKAVGTPTRPAWYCSGCPHNRSTRVPEGSIALAGIGCHVMATAIYPEHNRTMAQMGGEGVAWIGQAPFSERGHVFANLGDGTYFHSGHLAVRAAVAAGVNITYKLLFNDAVAMTGGQPVDGVLTVPRIAHQMAAEGVGRIAVVAEDPERHRAPGVLPAAATVHGRDELEAVQRSLREHAGVSVIIYDQTCAAEKRRRRRKGEFATPQKRLFIHETVCEGCGDCGAQSNCTAILPLETPLGRKRVIDQSACNQDFTCQEGFCPSFVSVTGAKPRRPAGAGRDAGAAFEPVPDPVAQALAEPFNLLITGVGGTGVITVGALLGMAAHLEGKGVSVLDMTGMSQKNGAVTSHVRIAAAPGDLRAQRIATGEADVVLGCDMLTAGAADAIAKTRPGRTVAIINTHQQPTGSFAQDPDWKFPETQVRALIDEAVEGRAHYLDATRVATALMGDAIATNLFMLGFAFQKGLVPVSAAALDRAIELNGVAVSANRQAFLWGRRMALWPEAVERAAAPARPVVLSLPRSLDTVVKDNAAFLTAYQDVAYAARYTALVERVRTAEAAAGRGDRLARAVAESLFRLMAAKDEYEVARLFSNGELERRVAAAFEGKARISYHLAPTWLGRRDPQGRPLKTSFGPWMRPVFGLLARLRFLRGTVLDPFARTEERRLERRLLQRYLDALERHLPLVGGESYDTLLEIAGLPATVRGYGHVKARHAETAVARWDALDAILASNTRPQAEAPRQAA